MEILENAIKHLKVGNFTGKQLDMAIEALGKQLPEKPMLMQFAEPEYMCDCGYKFYADLYKPNYCCLCGQKFQWD